MFLLCKYFVSDAKKLEIDSDVSSIVFDFEIDQSLVDEDEILLELRE